MHPRRDQNAADRDSALRLRDAGLRPTRQRVALADLLFAKGDRHLTAEELHEEAVGVGVPVRWPPSTTHCTSSPKPVC
jgi:Fur family iron response transcriptional regulator